MYRPIAVWFFIATLASSTALAQGGGRGTAVFHLGTTEILNVEPMENVPAIAGAPFTADATTEFTQMLSDGNRIERRFSTSLARDGKGRTRSEQDVAMLGPLVVLEKGMNWSTNSVHTTTAQQEPQPPRFTVITDPIDGVTYTLDERMKEARRNPSKISTLQSLEIQKLNDKLLAGANSVIVESLATRQFEGISAEGTRITTTIQAGQIGNLNPINVVTERWFAKDLQMAVLITRRDPRSGDTVYRLTNIVRAEPPPDVFTVPSDYRIVDLQNQVDAVKGQLEERKIRADQEIKKFEKARSGGQE
ncbi:MAG TPA: hypothetical protein VKA59_09105 [Vicinamibacterales bacterium]|nr:hypothetical protein [Vicinamibacterales bacterium]